MMKETRFCILFMCVLFLVFAIWLIYFSRFSELSHYVLPGKLRYMLDSFWLYVLLEPFNALSDGYFSILRAIADPTGQTIRFYNEMPIRWFYGISALVSFVIFKLHTLLLSRAA